jgi:hypothetical protein
MATSKVSVPQVLVSVALTAVVATQAWSLTQIIDHGKTIAAMEVEQRYSDQERADTKAWRERIENKIDAIEAKLTGGD